MMKTKIIQIDENNINNAAAEEAGRILAEGGLVAFPTETVYGLGADGLNETAAKRIYAAKGRPSDNPLILHITSMEELVPLVREIPETAKALAEAFWPGPMTMIFQKSDLVPYGTTGGLDTVAVRMPSHPVARAVIKAAGTPIAAPSANTSGRPSPTKASHVVEDMDGKIDMIVDGGEVGIGLESTIIDMSEDTPTILRPGYITKEMLEQVIGGVALDRASLGQMAPGVHPKAPGMKYRHYAPKAKLMIIEGETKEAVKAIRQVAFEQERLGYKVGIIATDETAEKYKRGIVKNIGTRENEYTIAQNLYRVLREFDEEDVDYIYSEAFAMDGIGSAVMNRLKKAAGHHMLRAEEITRLQKYRRILFLSNTDSSRGPMAAELLRNQELLQEYDIESRGLVVPLPEPVNQKAEAIMKSQGMSIADYKSRQFTEEDLDEETLVLAIDDRHKWSAVADYENIKNVYTLGEYIDDDRKIPSAYGQPLAEYGSVYEMMKEFIEKLAQKLNEEVTKA